jgi:hypothetical protein
MGWYIVKHRDKFTLPYFNYTLPYLTFLSLSPPLGGLGLHKIWLNFLEASQQFSFLQGGVVAPRPTPIPEDQASVFISPEAGWFSYNSPGSYLILCI